MSRRSLSHGLRCAQRRFTSSSAPSSVAVKLPNKIPAFTNWNKDRNLSFTEEAQRRQRWDQKKAQDDKKSGFFARHFSLKRAAVPIVALIAYYFQRSNAAEKEEKRLVAEVISSNPSEVKDLISRMRCSVHELEQIGAYLRLHFPQGRVPVDVVGEVCAKAVENFRASRPLPPQDDDVLDASVWKDDPVQAWHFDCLFRNYPFGERKDTTVSIEETMCVLSMLAFEEGGNIQKLELAWKTTGASLEESLDFAMFSLLLDRLIRTGHLDGPSLVHCSQIVPPRFESISGADIARRFFARLRLDAAKGDKISMEQFRDLSTKYSETTWGKWDMDDGFPRRWAPDFRVWYLSDTEMSRKRRFKAAHDKRREKRRCARLGLEPPKD